MARYRRKAFDWRKRATCIHMVRFHLLQMGHKRLPVIPDLRSPAGAARALAARGWPDLGAMMDTILPPIAPAAMLLGDIALLAGDPDPDAPDGAALGALVISVGGKAIGWHEDSARMAVMDLLSIERAWRA